MKIYIINDVNDYLNVWYPRNINSSLIHLYPCLTKRCPEPGWGYSSTGKNDIYNYCQSDKSWNMTELEECICKFYFEIKTQYKQYINSFHESLS